MKKGRGRFERRGRDSRLHDCNNRPTAKKTDRVVDPTSRSEVWNNVNAELLDTEIWATASFLTRRIFTPDTMRKGGLHVAGRRFPTSTLSRITRPLTEPAAVNKLYLGQRPSLRKFQPVHLPSTPTVHKKSKPVTPPAALRIDDPAAPTRDSQPRPVQRNATESKERPRGENSVKRRKAAAKSKAEKAFSDLLNRDDSTDSSSLGPPRCLPYLQPSPVPELPQTVCFHGAPAEKAAAGLTPLYGKKMTVHFGGLASTPVRLAFLKAGFRVSKSPTKCNVLWGIAPKTGTFDKMTRFQRVNHFPGSAELGRKDRLFRNYRLMQQRSPTEFNFMPPCYLLPEDRVSLRQDVAKYKGRRRYILKPVASSCGRGIHITSNPPIFTCAKEYVVQRYISNPMTIDGFKFDLRIYVAVTSYSPLRIYLYNDGLVRFATKSYTSAKSQMDDRFVHITNTSVNRQSTDYVKNRDADVADTGSKWSLKSFIAYLDRNTVIEWTDIWKQIKAIVLKTFLCVEGRMIDHVRLNHVPHASSCFELLGFDILLDSRSRAWLLEVNTFPDLSGSSPLDQRLKTAMIEDTMHMIGIVPSRGIDNGGWLNDSQGDAELQRRGGWEVVEIDGVVR